MRRVLVLSAALLALTADLQVSAQEQRSIFVSLAEGSSIRIRDLQPDDVTVVEDNESCQTLRVELVNRPIKLTVLVDNGTYGTMPADVNEIRNGLRGLFMAMPSGVVMSLQTTAPQVRWVVKPTTDKLQILSGINLVSPGGNAGQFFDGLADAGNRMETDENAFPVIVMVTTDRSTGTVRQQQFDKLRKQLEGHAATVHFVLLSTGNSSATSFTSSQNSGEGLARDFAFVVGALQTEIGQMLTKLTGGRYENIGASSRLATLLQELGQQIARSDARQRNSVKVTYQSANPKAAPKSLSVRVPVGAQLGAISLDGHLP